jgi:alpha-aminoadipic semialdehyde synthase
MPTRVFRDGGRYVFFSHTMKGQEYNMAMLAELVRHGCTLVDYECVKDAEGRRLIFFSRHAGTVGMLDSLWTLGQRYAALGHDTPLAELMPTHRYDGKEAALSAVDAVAERIASEGLPVELCPLVIGITGGGNVAAGAREVFGRLPIEEIAPAELESWVQRNAQLRDRIGIVQLDGGDLVENAIEPGPFEWQHYFDHPERYRSRTAPWLSHLSMLVHGIYWDDRYPVLVTRDDFAKLFEGGVTPKLQVIGDITCDVDGSLASTVRDTQPGDPVYVYDPRRDTAPSGFGGEGIAVMAVGNLPAELPIEASGTFSGALEQFIPAMAAAKLDGSLEESGLPDPIRRAVILWRGEFAPDFAAMREYLD